MATGTNIDIPKLNGFEACIMNISKCGRFTKIKKNERITGLEAINPRTWVATCNRKLDISL